MSPRTVAALFVSEASVYKALPGVDAWDIERDARGWPGGCPIVAHPPCRTWGRFSHFASKALPGEHELAPLAIAFARAHGGVVEHPAGSTLFARLGLPRPGSGQDAFGGWTLGITQHWWGHRAEKKTLLYIVGVDPRRIPALPPLMLGKGTHTIAPNYRGLDWSGELVRPGDPLWRPHVTHAERDATPLALALWLVDLARRCSIERLAA